MPWARLDDGLYDHPKLDALGRSKLSAIGLFVLTISWSNRRLTDGFVPTDRVIALGGTKALADLLVDARLFDRADGGYLIHDFLEFNDSAVTVQARRDAAAERQRRHRSVTRDEDRDATPLSQRDSRRDFSSIARAQDRVRPDPTDSSPVLDTPKSPPSGDDEKGKTNPRDNGTNPRALGTSPRQLASAAAIEATEQVNARRWRVNQRLLAYSRGAITEAQQIAMNAADAPLEEIPDWAEHQAKLADTRAWVDL